MEGENKTILDADAIRLIAQASNALGISKFTISGGEPMVNKDFLEILSTLREFSPRSQINMASNLSLVRQGQLQRIVELIDQLNVNFQAATTSGFKYMTRLDKFEAICRRLDEICALGGGEKISLNYVYTRANKAELRNVLEFSESRGLKLKILEVIRDEQNEFLHIPSAILCAELATLGYESHTLVGRSDEYFVKNGAPSRVRVIHSYCNLRDETACRVHGEVRITPELELRPCIERSDNGISIVEEVRSMDVPALVRKLEMAANKMEKTCPVQELLSASSA